MSLMSKLDMKKALFYEFQILMWHIGIKSKMLPLMKFHFLHKWTQTEIQKKCLEGQEIKISE